MLFTAKRQAASAADGFDKATSCRWALAGVYSNCANYVGYHAQAPKITNARLGDLLSENLGMASATIIAQENTRQTSRGTGTDRNSRSF